MDWIIIPHIFIALANKPIFTNVSSKKNYGHIPELCLCHHCEG